MGENIANYIDYTVLKPDTTKETIIKLCNDAKEDNCASVCINPYYVGLAKSILDKTNINICTVIGFPLGANCKETKAFEADLAIKNGANEIDMVINIGALKDKDYDIVREDISAVAQICKEKNVILKVIIEACLLTDTEKQVVSNIITDVGCEFVKTSTGFSTGGATIEDVKLIKQSIGNKAKIKAAGGIRDYKTACDMIKAGADRIGASQKVYKPTASLS